MLISILLLAVISTAKAEDNCLVYAYTEDSEHYFLIQNNATVYGSKLFINHNCETVSVEIDGYFEQQSSQNFSVEIESGSRDIRLNFDNNSLLFENVFVIPSTLEWADEYQIVQEEIRRTTIENLNRSLNTASIGTAIMIWVLTVFIYWKLINHYVDRNYFEEVI